MRILECPPSDKQGYVDEADKFYMDPSLWLTQQFVNSSGRGDQDQLPTHIVLYNVLLPVSQYSYLFIESKECLILFEVFR